MDKHEIDDATRIRILTETSQASAGGTVSRQTVAPKTTDAIDDEDFGFSETFEFFENPKTYDPVSGTDS